MNAKEKIIIILDLQIRYENAFEEYTTYCSTIFAEIDEGKIKMSEDIAKNIKAKEKAADKAKFQLLEACK